MNWLNFRDAVKLAEDLTWIIPNEYDFIVGVPRSGMWLASLIACKFGRPLASPDGSVWFSKMLAAPTGSRALIVDDTVSLGGALENARRQLTSWICCNPHAACLVVQPGSEHLVDYHRLVMTHPRLFEWNLAHAKKGRVAYDIDGVLCLNPPSTSPEFLASSDYASWLGRARPHLLPSYPVELVVTGRTERCRTLTEAWLRRYGIRYGRLVMAPEEHERTAAWHAGHKAQACRDLAIDYMVESDTNQAVLIAEAAGIPVISTDNMEMHGG